MENSGGGIWQRSVTYRENMAVAVPERLNWSAAVWDDE